MAPTTTTSFSSSSSSSTTTTTTTTTNRSSTSTSTSTSSSSSSSFSSTTTPLKPILKRPSSTPRRPRYQIRFTIHITTRNGIIRRLLLRRCRQPPHKTQEKHVTFSDVVETFERKREQGCIKHVAFSDVVETFSRKREHGCKRVRFADTQEVIGAPPPATPPKRVAFSECVETFSRKREEGCKRVRFADIHEVTGASPPRRLSSPSPPPSPAPCSKRVAFPDHVETFERKKLGREEKRVRFSESIETFERKKEKDRKRVRFSAAEDQVISSSS